MPVGALFEQRLIKAVISSLVSGSGGNRLPLLGFSQPFARLMSDFREIAE
jgi:hypothetical protein